MFSKACKTARWPAFSKVPSIVNWVLSSPQKWAKMPLQHRFVGNVLTKNGHFWVALKQAKNRQRIEKTTQVHPSSLKHPVTSPFPAPFQNLSHPQTGNRGTTPADVFQSCDAHYWFSQILKGGREWHCYKIARSIFGPCFKDEGYTCTSKNPL